MTMTALSINYYDEHTHHQFNLPLTAFKKPSNLDEYLALETILDTLIDEVKDQETHPMALAMQIIGDNLEQYDSEYHSDIGANVSDIDMVKYLMQSNHLYQKDLAEIFGGQANVSKFLNGERELGKKAIKGLKKKFGLSADFFI